MDVLGDQKRCTRVAQAVEGKSLAFESGALQERLVLPVVEVVLGHRPGDPAGKNETGVTLLMVAQLLLILAYPMSP